MNELWIRIYNPRISFDLYQNKHIVSLIIGDRVFTGIKHLSLRSASFVKWRFIFLAVVMIEMDFLHFHKYVHIYASFWKWWYRSCQCWIAIAILSLQWRHNGRDSVSNHHPHDCLLNRLFRRRSKKTSKIRVTGISAGNSPGTGEFSTQMASYAENVSIWCRHHVLSIWC